VTYGDAGATYATPPGWYPDPGRAGWFRWWTGAAWSADVAPPSSRDEFSAINLLVPRQQSLPRRALFWGIVAVLIPMVWDTIFAIVYGALGLARARRKASYGQEPEGRGASIAGIVLGCASLVSGILWIALLFLLPTLGR
jgi:hypothetical protein